MVSISKTDVRSLAFGDETQTDLIGDNELDTFIDLAEKKVARELANADQSTREEAAKYWACKLVADALYGADAVQQDGDLALEHPSHYEQNYMQVADEEKPTADVFDRATSS